MIENTLENKAKFFALYMHQELCIPEKPDEGYHPFCHNEKGLFLDGILGNKIVVRRIAERVYDGRNQTRLLLKPLSSITDEDAIKVQKIATTKKDVDMLFNTLSKEKALFECRYTAEYNKHYEIIDFLRSRGYLLPWMGLTPDEIVSYGWAQYKGD